MRKIEFILLITILFGLCGCEKKTFSLESKKEIISEKNTNEIIVDVKGAIMLPGVYIVPEDYLVKDVIYLAGGLTQQANIDSVNLAAPISNNEMIVIPYNTTLTNDSVNINKALSDELMTLSGIGESKALAIIEYRNKNGLFTSIDDLKKVNGINETLFEKIKDRLSLI